ncbi:MAG TPA: PQQ-binding-like beta-propeller repeat protein [Candidatus Polarisedimenticolia bacterium]|jgi:outer membrane protein assembly factor BamB
MTPFLRGTLISTIGCAALMAGAGAADWPQWRGPQRDGVAAGVVPPAVWPEKLVRAWSVPVGEGHAGPILVGDRVFVHAREEDREVVRALRLSDGGTLWRVAWPISYEMNPAATGHGKGPKATPVEAGGTLFTFGITGVISALDAATGDLRWRKDFSTEFKATSPLYGAAASPLVVDDLVITHVGGHHDGSLSAFDVKTGKRRWALKGDGPGYASPILAELAGRRQIITQTDQRIVGVAASDGRLLWSLPFTTPYDQNIVTPLLFENLLIVSGIEQGVRAYTFETKGEDLSPREVWSRKDASFYMSSPVLASGRLFGLSLLRQRQLVCLDPKTGEVQWMSPGRVADQVTLVAAGTFVLALTDGGELIVLPAASKEFSPLARYRVAESPTWAHPVPVPHGVIVKDRTDLSLWSWGS